MACYSNKYKACCRPVVMGVSVIMFLMGLITAVFGGMSAGAIPGGDKLSFIPDMSKLALGIIILGVVCILIGINGCCLAKYKNPCWAIPFIILTGLIGLICLILGFVMVGGSGMIRRATNLACQGAQDVF